MSEGRTFELRWPATHGTNRLDAERDLERQNLTLKLVSRDQPMIIGLGVALDKAEALALGEFLIEQAARL